MFTSALAMKCLIGVSSIGVLTAALAFSALNILGDLPSPSTKSNAIVVVNATTKADHRQTAELSVEGASKNYSCRLSGTTINATECKLVKLTIDKWIDLSGIKNAEQTTAIPAADLNSAANYFRLDVDKDFLKTINLTDAKTIEVVSTEASKTVFGTLDALFTIDGSDVKYTNIQYLLGKADDSAASVTAGATYQCPFTTITNTTPNATCTFFPFGTTTGALTGPGYANQTVSALPGTVVTTALAPHNYYLIKFNTPLTPEAVATNQALKVFSIDSSTNAVTAKSGFNNVVPVLLHGSTVADQKAFILSETPSYSVIVAKTSAITSGKQLTYNQTTKNYKCKTGSIASVDCALIPIPFTANKTSFNLTEIKNAALSGDALPAIDSSKTKTYYKIEVDATFFDNFKTNLSTKSIQIVDKDASESTILTLQPILSIDDTTSYFDTSDFIVKKTTLSSAVSLTSGNDRWCSFSNTGSAETTPKKCHITDLGATIDANNSFAKSATEPTSITANNHYLVNFIESPHTSGLAKGSNVTDNVFYLQEATTSAPATKTSITDFAVAEVTEAIIVDSETAGQKYAFILKAS